MWYRLSLANDLTMATQQPLLPDWARLRAEGRQGQVLASSQAPCSAFSQRPEETRKGSSSDLPSQVPRMSSGTYRNDCRWGWGTHQCTFSLGDWESGGRGRGTHHCTFSLGHWGPGGRAGALTTAPPYLTHFSTLFKECRPHLGQLCYSLSFCQLGLGEQDATSKGVL